MKKDITSVLVAGLLVLFASMIVLYAGIFLFPTLMEEYYSAVFRSSSFETDWLFYAHPFILAFALRWFWDRSKREFSGSPIAQAAKTAFMYGLVAMLPVLWLTFSAIDISLLMVITWLLYGVLQAFVATIVFAKVYA